MTTTRTKDAPAAFADGLLRDFQEAVNVAKLPYHEHVARVGLASVTQAQATEADRDRLRHIAAALSMDQLESALFRYAGVLCGRITPEDRRGPGSAACVALLHECIRRGLLSVGPEDGLWNDRADAAPLEAVLHERTDAEACLLRADMTNDLPRLARISAVLSLMREDLSPLEHAWLYAHIWGLALPARRLSGIERADWRGCLTAPLPDDMETRVQARIEQARMESEGASQAEGADDPESRREPGEDGYAVRRDKNSLLVAYCAAYTLWEMLSEQSERAELTSG